MKFCILMFVICAIIWGCAATQRAIVAFREENPEANVIPVDEDHNGHTDFYGVDNNQDGIPDAIDGVIIEVPETRAEFNIAKAQDIGVVEVASGLGALGFGIGGFIGRLWGRFKPMQTLRDVVTQIEVYKQKLTSTELERFRSIMKSTQDRPSTNKFVDEIVSANREKIRVDVTAVK